MWDFDLSLIIFLSRRDGLPLVPHSLRRRHLQVLFLRRTIHACHDSGIVNEYKPATQAWTLSYLLTDHLSSVVAVTDSTGALISQQRYLPFGGERTNLGTISQTDYGYTGQRDLGQLGLMDYKARFYSPYLNQFTQPDTIVPDLYNPQDWNRYAYARNNPVKYTDPTGHVGCTDDSCEYKMQQKTYTEKETISYKIEKNYSADLEGAWKVNELENLYQALRTG